VVHVGLGRAAKVARVDVIWPSGIRQSLRNVQADRLVTIREPKR
jgi:hypothetical protein